MPEDLISKKELLERFAISYGALYRWKRMGLIPEDWFIKKSTVTGQETFFPRSLILERVEWIMSRKDEASLETLRQLAQSRIEAKLEETVTYAPDQYVIVEKAELLTNGLYLALFISPDVDTLKAGFEAAFQ